MAMRQSYWNDNHSEAVLIEKQFFQQILIENGIFENSSLDDAKYLFLVCPAWLLLRDMRMVFTRFCKIDDSQIYPRQQSAIDEKSRNQSAISDVKVLLSRFSYFFTRKLVVQQVELF